MKISKTDRIYSFFYTHEKHWKIIKYVLYFRPSSPFPLIFTTLNDRGTINSNENVKQNNFEDISNSAKENQLNVNTNKDSDSDYSNVENNSNDVYDYYEDYYQAGFENDDSKSNIKKRSYTAPQANAAIAAAASAQV